MSWSDSISVGKEPDLEGSTGNAASSDPEPFPRTPCAGMRLTYHRDGIGEQLGVGDQDVTLIGAWADEGTIQYPARAWIGTKERFKNKVTRSSSSSLLPLNHARQDVHLVTERFLNEGQGGLWTKCCWQGCPPQDYTGKLRAIFQWTIAFRRTVCSRKIAPGPASVSGCVAPVGIDRLFRSNTPWPSSSTGSSEQLQLPFDYRTNNHMTSNTHENDHYGAGKTSMRLA
jgi:hypothetical protein